MFKIRLNVEVRVATEFLVLPLYQLYLSTITLYCGWYAVIQWRLSPGSLRDSEKTDNFSRIPRSVIIIAGTAKHGIHYRQKASAQDVQKYLAEVSHQPIIVRQYLKPWESCKGPITSSWIV